MPNIFPVIFLRRFAPKIPVDQRTDLTGCRVREVPDGTVLKVPRSRNVGMKEVRQEQPGWLVPADDGAGDRRTQKGQIEGQAYVPPVKTEALGERLDGPDFTVFEQLPEAMGAGNCLDERQVNICG